MEGLMLRKRMFPGICLVCFFITGCFSPKVNKRDVSDSSFTQVSLAAGKLPEDEKVSSGFNFSGDESYVWDFGQIKEGEIARHEFIFSNKTDNTLEIKNVNTSCGCTVPEVRKKLLMPGEATVIEVRFNSKGYSGIVEQFIYVNTDSVSSPVVKLTIKAEVVRGS